MINMSLAFRQFLFDRLLHQFLLLSFLLLSLILFSFPLLWRRTESKFQPCWI